MRDPALRGARGEGARGISVRELRDVHQPSEGYPSQGRTDIPHGRPKRSRSAAHCGPSKKAAPRRHEDVEALHAPKLEALVLSSAKA